ncbi:MAG: phospholipase D-like domain-containing protein [Neisseria sp.]|nr:phospholipase D-like domain-containing protein [Neisseria sp.]
MSQSNNALLEQIVLRASGTRASSGNHIEILLDSTENFPAWEAAILAAQESVCIEMYIIANNAFGKRIRQILLDKLAQGIAVAIVYDWLGSLPASVFGYFRPLIQAGATVRAYHPPSRALGLSFISRNHRKSIIIDEKIAFVSGLCISSNWQGDAAKNIAPWRDTGLKLTGPIVQEVLAAFTDSLQSQGGKLPARLRNYEAGEGSPCGNAAARVLATTPDNINTMRLDLNLIGLARQNLWLTDAYFMPTRMYVQALINAANAGVDVRILVPRTSDIKWIGTVSRTQYRSLLEAGVRVFEWNGTMLHAKSALIDGQWARVGSTNLNLSSWYANRELDISIEDPNTVYQLERIFLNDLNQATEVILDAQSHARLRENRSQTFAGLKKLHPDQLRLAWRQIMQLSLAFDTSDYATRWVAPSEAWASLSIGISLILFAVFLYFVPQILLYPLLLILGLSGGIAVWQASKRLWQVRQNQANRQK